LGRRWQVGETHTPQRQAIAPNCPLLSANRISSLAAVNRNRRVSSATIFRLSLLLVARNVVPESLPPLSETTRQQIQERMRQHLRELPNCTCEQNIRQYSSSWRPVRFRLLARIQLQVAYEGGKELFATREGEPFTETDMHQWAQRGAIANDGFALLSKDVFSSPGPVFHYFGKERLHVRPVLRYDFRMSSLNSHFVLEAAGKQATVGYHGSFWADENLFDVVRLEVEADEIPFALGLDRIFRRLEYGWVSVSGSKIYLSRSSEMRVVGTQNPLPGIGAFQYETRSRWSKCRLYRTASTVIFRERPGSKHRPEKPLQ